MYFAESRGSSLKKTRELDQEKRPHHIRLFRHEDDSEDAPKWVLESHGSDNDASPRQDEFEGDQELLDLIVAHILGRQITGRRKLRKGRHSTILEETNNHEQESESEY
jgi:hypothetical protein